MMWDILLPLIGAGCTALGLFGKWLSGVISTKLGKSTFLKNLNSYLKEFIIKAEQLFHNEKTGAQKKEYVMSLIKSKCEALKISKLWAVLEPTVSELIDSIVAEYNSWSKVENN